MACQIRIYHERHPEHEYAMGVDPALGYSDSDDSVLNLVDCNTGEQAAEMQQKVGGDVLCEEAYMLGLHYNEAMIGVEVNKDLTCVNGLFRLGYPHIYFRAEETGRPFRAQTDKLGWDTNLRTRPMLVTQGVKMVKDGSVIMRSQKLIDQWKHFVLEKGKFQALSGGHDDLVMAFLICCEMVKWQLHMMTAREKSLMPLIDGVPIDQLDKDDPNLTRSERLAQHVLAQRSRNSFSEMDGLM